MGAEPPKNKCVIITECLNNNRDYVIFESDRHIFASPVAAKFVYKYSRGYENVILAKNELISRLT